MGEVHRKKYESNVKKRMIMCQHDPVTGTWLIILGTRNGGGCHHRTAARAFYSEVRKYAFFMHFLHDDKSASLTNEYFVV